MLLEIAKMANILDAVGDESMLQAAEGLDAVIEHHINVEASDEDIAADLLRVADLFEASGATTAAVILETIVRNAYPNGGAVENKKVIGFLCYSSYCGKMLLMWMGVKKEFHRKGVGERLLKWLEKKAKKLNLYSIEVETLPDEDKYEPYKITRNFYYKHGFKRIYYKKARIKGWDDQIVLEKKIK